MKTKARKSRVNQALVFEFASALREIRREKGLTQEQVAFASNVHRTYIAFLEGAKRQPSIEAIFKVADGLGIKPSELIRRIEKNFSIRKE